MYNVILFTDAPSSDWFSRGYGAYRLATELREHGYTVLTVDFSSTLSWENYKTIIDNTVGPDTLFVGFSTTWFPYRSDKAKNPRYIVGFKSLGLNPDIDFDPNTYEWYRESLAYNFSCGDIDRYIDYIKSVNDKTKVICGGAKANEYVKEQKLDNIFIGYSEAMLIHYADSLSKRGPRRIFNKIVNYDIKGHDPSFDFKQSNTIYVESDFLYHKEILTIEFSRGCIFNCSFCSYPHRNQDPSNYIKYSENIYNELLTNYNNYGVYRYVITDDTFNDSTEKLQLISDVIKRLPFKPEFWAYIRMDLISRFPEQAQLLKDIGIKETYYGLETWNSDTAKRIKKGGSNTKKIEGMRIAKECWGDDVYVIAGIVIGLPLDTIKSLDDSVEWYRNEGHKYVDLFGYASLTLSFPDSSWDYKFLSDIEKDLEGYGYSYVDPINDPLSWRRKDSGDIVSKEMANRLMMEYNDKVKDKWTTYGSCWDWRTVFDYDINRGIKTSAQLVYNHVMLHYWPKLLNYITSHSVVAH